jgi:hypothetical protein
MSTVVAVQGEWQRVGSGFGSDSNQRKEVTGEQALEH